jgi:hypothetical protein
MTSEHAISDAEYASALAQGHTKATTEVRALAVHYLAERDVLEIETICDGNFMIPRTWIDALRDIPVAELAQLKIWSDGSAIELEARDIQISVDGLLAAVSPAVA